MWQVGETAMAWSDCHGAAIKISHQASSPCHQPPVVCDANDLATDYLLLRVPPIGLRRLAHGTDNRGHDNHDDHDDHDGSSADRE
jgi:hypothetical protein